MTSLVDSPVRTAPERVVKPGNSVNYKPESREKLPLAIAFDFLSIILTVIFVFWSFEPAGAVLFAWHPALFSVGYVLFMTEALLTYSGKSMLSRYVRLYKNRVLVHWVLQSIAAICITLGLATIVAHKLNRGKHHFHSYHAIIGLIATILCLFSVLVGVATKYNVRLKEFLKPVTWKIIHSLLGLTGYILGGVAMILGLYTGWYTRNRTIGDKVFAFVAIVFVWLYAILNPLVAVYQRIGQLQT